MVTPNVRFSRNKRRSGLGKAIKELAAIVQPANLLGGLRILRVGDEYRHAVCLRKSDGVFNPMTLTRVKRWKRQGPRCKSCFPYY